MEDEICDLQGAQYVHTELVGTDKTLKVYEACLHEVLNEPDREQVIADVVAWLDAHLEVAPVT
jgi:alpha-beta hydrolase superfamily lysophospholipase